MFKALAFVLAVCLLAASASAQTWYTQGHGYGGQMRQVTPGPYGWYGVRPYYQTGVRINSYGSSYAYPNTGFRQFYNNTYVNPTYSNYGYGGIGFGAAPVYGYGYGW